MNKNGHEQRKEREVLAKVASLNKVLQLHVNGGEQPQFLVLVNKLLCPSETEADVMQLLMSHSSTPWGLHYRCTTSCFSSTTTITNSLRLKFSTNQTFNFSTLAL